MLTDRAEAGIEIVIAQHVAASFQGREDKGEASATVVQIRNRFTNSFPAGDLPIEQDNQPPALVELYRRIAAAFAPIAIEPHPAERASQLTGLKGSLKALPSSQDGVKRNHLLEHARACLLVERQQLFLKNEFTEGFGRIESWILSIAFLTLVMLGAISLVWALPILALSIVRAWHLDRLCKRRAKKISEIDALIDRIDLAPHVASGSAPA